MTKHEMWELKQMQSLPLEAKIKKTQQRIREWVDVYGVDGVYISFSGGKDSTVLLDIARKMYPNIEAVFVNTGLEYPSVRRFALSKKNVTEIRPKMNFRDVVCKYGYPIISKEVGRNVGDVQKLGEECFAYRMFDGSMKSPFNKQNYAFLLEAPFHISSKCCDFMKKSPLHEVSKIKKPFTAQMADESKQRRSQWLQNGCNAFELKNPISNPMSFWLENDVLTYIHTYIQAGYCGSLWECNC
jgi:3'-phosphoadenosine 5'-phosphosulfate sulfotransferase (PAPS reductase)/FAD synthetase